MRINLIDSATGEIFRTFGHPIEVIIKPIAHVVKIVEPEGFITEYEYVKHEITEEVSEEIDILTAVMDIVVVLNG